MWSVGTILNGLLSFMTDTAQVAKADFEHGELALMPTLYLSHVERLPLVCRRQAA